MRERVAGRLTLPLVALPQSEALLHGHCHQKAFAALTPIADSAGLDTRLCRATIESSCCGMAGAFGYQAEHFEVSMQMGEAGAAARSAQRPPTATDRRRRHSSCRHQIRDGARRDAMHVASVLAMALGSA